MKNIIFITGTDTDIGKTFVTCMLLKAFNEAGLNTLALKPIESGCHRNGQGQLRNDDALQLQQHASIKIPYSSVNPIAFEPPIAPHIAAHNVGIALSTRQICEAIKSSACDSADIILIEGVGGWAVPLNRSELLSDVVVQLEIPVILVVGVKLGCLNHSLLTYQNIKAKNVSILGWVANCIDSSALSIQENINTLEQWIAEPCLGIVPYGDNSTACINTKLISDWLI